MPKEHVRKRGKRKPKTEESLPIKAPSAVDEAAIEDAAAAEAAAAGIHPSRLAFMRTGVRPPVERPDKEGEGGEGNGEGEEGGDGSADWTRLDRSESEFPFGVLDPDVKAYFRNVEEQIKDWESADVESTGEEREDRQIFLASVLSELRGHELQVATDAETSVVFERLLPSLNDWGRRVVGDAVGNNWQTLIRHRFGSHVAQTWLSLAAGTLDREARGVYPAQHHEQAKKSEEDGSEGTLPTMAELINSLVNDILHTVPTLLVSPHASPVIRLLLLVLTPNRALPSLDAGDAAGGADLVRSKRSGKWRKGQGVQGKSILGDDEDKGKSRDSETRRVPTDVVELRAKIRHEVSSRLSPMEWHGMGVDKVGSAAVQLLLEVEVEDGEAEKEGSVLDIITEGLITHLESSSDEAPKVQPYLYGILVSPTGTRLFEALLRLAPRRIFSALWSTYFVGKLGKLAGHPFANFVVAQGISLLDSKAVRLATKEVKAVAGGKGLIKMARTSVLLAMAERAASQSEKTQGAVMALVQSALDLGENTDALVPALMTLKTYPLYEALRTGTDVPDDNDEMPSAAVDADAEAKARAAAARTAWENRRNAGPRGKLDPNMQGCLLLQALVGLSASNEVVLDSLFAQPIETLLAYATSPIASHFIDKILTSNAVSPKYRRKVYLGYMGHYNTLACDKLGSRVADTIWATADGFMKEKIARSLIPHATMLGTDRYGRFLAKKLDLHLLQRRPDEWRQAQIGIKHHFAHQSEAAAGVEVDQVEPDAELKQKTEDKKRKRENRDAIDDVFASVDKKKRS